MPVLLSYTTPNCDLLLTHETLWLLLDPLVSVLTPVVQAVHTSHAMKSPNIALICALICVIQLYFSVFCLSSFHSFFFSPLLFLPTRIVGRNSLFLHWVGDTFRAVTGAAIKIEIQRHVGRHLFQAVEHGHQFQVPWSLGDGGKQVVLHCWVHPPAVVCFARTSCQHPCQVSGLLCC